MPSTPRLHATAAAGFGSTGALYERARPAYPPATVTRLGEVLGLVPGSTLVELGAGTGKMTRLLARPDLRLIACEPSASMLRAMPAGMPGVSAVACLAEAIPLPSGCADGVVVAQAFHWFSAPEALSEIHRVLRPGGVLALCWNVRHLGAEAWADAFGDRLDASRDEAPRYAAGRWREASAWGLFSPLVEESVRHDEAIAPADLVDRIASVSWVVAKPEVERRTLLADLAEVLATHPGSRGRSVLEMPHRVDLFWCRRG